MPHSSGSGKQIFGAKQQVPHAGGSDKEAESAMTAQPTVGFLCGLFEQMFGAN